MVYLKAKEFIIGVKEIGMKENGKIEMISHNAIVFNWWITRSKTLACFLVGSPGSEISTPTRIVFPPLAAYEGGLVGAVQDCLLMHFACQQDKERRLLLGKLGMMPPSGKLGKYMKKSWNRQILQLKNS